MSACEVTDAARESRASGTFWSTGWTRHPLNAIGSKRRNRNRSSHTLRIFCSSAFSRSSSVWKIKPLNAAKQEETCTLNCKHTHMALCSAAVITRLNRFQRESTSKPLRRSDVPTETPENNNKDSTHQTVFIHFQCRSSDAQTHCSH